MKSPPKLAVSESIFMSLQIVGIRFPVRNLNFEVFSMLFVGIDIAKRNHEASVIAQDGSVVRKAMRFANSQASYNKFMDMVRGLKEPVVFGMEAAGHYWLTLYTPAQRRLYGACHQPHPVRCAAWHVHPQDQDRLHRQRYHR